jgi:YceI-like protein
MPFTIRTGSRWPVPARNRAGSPECSSAGWSGGTSTSNGSRLTDASSREWEAYWPPIGCSFVKWPDIVFKSTRIEEVGDNALVVSGDLTLRDITKPITIPIEFTGVETDAFGALRAGFEGTRRIDRREYGLEWNMALDSGGWLLSEKITLEFEIPTIKRESDAQQAA